MFKRMKEGIQKKLKDIRLEKAQISSANKIIRQKATAEALREKQTQELRIARERQKIIADRKIEEIRKNKGRSGFWTAKPTFEYFGVPTQSPSKKKRKDIPQQRFDPIGSIGGNKKYDVLGF
jgi:hypothetical protein